MLREWKPLAEQGDADAQVNLGVMYLEGQNVPRNDKTAFKWFTLAAGQGHSDGQYNLGRMYFEGQNVPRNDKTAIKWFTLAAGQGHSDAQYYLGLIYYKGVGVPRNDETAVKWFTLAAEQGTSDAQVNLDRVGKLIQSDEDGDHREDDLASVLSNEGQPWEATSKLMWLGRGVFWIGLVYIVGHAALTSYRANDFVMLVAKLIFFPITFLLYPWYVGLWWLLLLSLAGYWASTCFYEPFELWLHRRSRRLDSLSSR